VVGDCFLRSCAGSPCQSAPCTLERTRRSLPAVGFGVRSQKPVGSAGWVAAIYIKMAPATQASAGRR